MLRMQLEMHGLAKGIMTFLINLLNARTLFDGQAWRGSWNSQAKH